MCAKRRKVVACLTVSNNPHELENAAHRVTAGVPHRLVHVYELRGLKDVELVQEMQLW